MKLSSGSKTVTYTIIGINVLIFAAMIMSGVHAFEPLVADIAKWGGNYKPYTLSGDWWRLIISTFVHIGIIHIAFNMYALYMVGIYLEPMLGKSRYIVAYLCTGVLASLASTWWHGSEMVSAGASGAIFGLYGVLLALLTTKLIPTTMRKGLLQSMGIFVVYNLIYGARSEATDNAAHLGGLLSGFVIGYLYFLSLKNAERFRPAMISGITVLATVLVTVFYLNGSVDQSAAYQAKLFAFGEIEEKALAPLQKYEQGEPNMLNDISTISVAQWQKAKKLFDETENYKLDEKMSGHRALIRKYIDLRIKHTDLLIVSMQGDKNLDGEINELGNQLNETVEKILKSNRE
jgi:rhomboid protease GluP